MSSTMVAKVYTALSEPDGHAEDNILGPAACTKRTATKPSFNFALGCSGAEEQNDVVLVPDGYSLDSRVQQARGVISSARKRVHEMDKYNCDTSVSYAQTS